MKAKTVMKEIPDGIQLTLNYDEADKLLIALTAARHDACRMRYGVVDELEMALRTLLIDFRYKPKC